MLDYGDYEKAVYDAFLKKRNEDSRFNFSVRIKASKGAEKDYFIGTKNGKYFMTTLWKIKVGFPGSAGELINILFSYVRGGKFGYTIEFNQTKNPKDDQNRFALELIRKIEPIVEEKLGLIKKSKQSQKIHNYKTNSRKKSYSNLDEMMDDVFLDLENLISIVNNTIEKIKAKHPEFVAHPITNEEFVLQQKKLNERINLVEENAKKHNTEGEGIIKKKEEIRDNFISKNTIFFGPPGTGKTYSTINISIQIIENLLPASISRTDAKKRFSSLQRQKRIFFNTFHQNMSYEDFIEGIKPIKSDEEETFLKYEIQDGLFMQACIEATYNFHLKNNKSDTSVEHLLDFNALYDLLFEEVSSGKISEIKTVSNVSLEISVTAQGNFSIIHKGKERPYTVSKDRLSRIYDVYPDPKVMKNIHEYIRGVIGGSNSTAYWAVLNHLASQRDKYRKGKVAEYVSKELTYNDKKKIVQGIWEKRPMEVMSEDNSDPFVFIIDEINRGNVSQIFGELITLIEPDKRLGKDEALFIDLPYSKTAFAVPPNLYIIGTMNTADRSVEALDTALRRRFSFEEMPPDYNLKEINKDISEFNLSKMLKIINTRVERLLDKDHLIGHSYFVNVQNLNDLKSTFQHKIIPLLQEYFFGDYGKIGLILGERFFENDNEDQEVKFKNFLDYSDDGFSEKKIYRLKNINLMKNEEFTAALTDMMN